MSDDGHVVGAMAGPQAGQVLLELDIEHPVELVFDGPVAAHGAGETGRVEGRGRDVEARRSVEVWPAFSTVDSTIPMMVGPAKRGSPGSRRWPDIQSTAPDTK